MTVSEKDLRLIRKGFENKNKRNIDKIRIGNRFVDDFIFDDSEAADIPINALRVIFNIISIISNEQFRPQDRPKQLSLFDEEFETENNIFASIKIKNKKISPSGSTRQVIDAYEFLAKFKMSWYKSVNSKGKEIKTFGGLISTPSYDKRGYTTFLVSSYWLKKLLVIPEYNYVLYNLVYNVRNNKHIIFAIWLSKLPENGTVLKLSTLNKKFGLKYKTTKDFCFKFLKPARISLNTFNTLTFNYTYNKDSISIIPFLTRTILENKSAVYTRELPFESSGTNIAQSEKITRRLIYFKNRYGLLENEMIQFSHQYKNFSQTRDLIEKAFKEFIRINRLKKIKSTVFQGKDFLNEIQRLIYYRKQDSYLFWMYEMVTEWITSDDENEETPIYLSEIKQVEHIGDFMEQKIYNQHNLTRFKDHLKNFKAKDGFDNDCFMLARKVFSLYEQYPNAAIYQNLQQNTEEDYEYEIETTVSIDKYVSFCAEGKRLLFQTLFETVNSEFQECTTMEEPMVIKKFDGSNITNNNLDFENRLFPLIEELIYILNNF